MHGMVQSWSWILNFLNKFSEQYIPKDKPSTSQPPNIVPLPNPEDDVSDGESSSTGSDENGESSDSDDDSFERQGNTFYSDHQVTHTIISSFYLNNSKVLQIDYL
jgi:hypothetical protein